MEQLSSSSSVRALLEGFDPNLPVPAVDLVIALLKRHPEYGRGVGGSIVGRLKADQSATRLPALEWEAKVKEWVEEQRYVVDFLHGRLLIDGLSRIDDSTAKALRQEGFLKALRDELGDFVRASAGESANTASPARDQLLMLNDSVADNDYLNRKPVAEILATSMDRVREDPTENESFFCTSTDPGDRASRLCCDSWLTR